MYLLNLAPQNELKPHHTLHRNKEYTNPPNTQKYILFLPLTFRAGKGCVPLLEIVLKVA